MYHKIKLMNVAQNRERERFFEQKSVSVMRKFPVFTQFIWNKNWYFSNELKFCTQMSFDIKFTSRIQLIEISSTAILFCILSTSKITLFFFKKKIICTNMNQMKNSLTCTQWKEGTANELYKCLVTIHGNRTCCEFFYIDARRKKIYDHIDQRNGTKWTSKREKASVFVKIEELQNEINLSKNKTSNTKNLAKIKNNTWQKVAVSYQWTLKENKN